MKVDFFDPRMRAVADEDPPLVQLARGLGFGEGPVWHAGEKRLYFVEIVGDRVNRWTPGSGIEAVISPSGHLNGMTLDHQGRLVIAGWSARKVLRLEPDGSLTTLAAQFEGKKISTPNDIIVRSDGAVLWTDMQNALFIPGMEGEDCQRYLDWQGVFCLSPDGALSQVTEDLPGPNGLAFSPDEKRLYVTDTPTARVLVFELDGAGRASPAQEFYKLQGEEPGHADGVKVDSAGNVYTTGPAGIHVIAMDGTLLGRLHIGGSCTNLAWGDDDWRSLYVTTIDALYRVRLKTPGIPVGQGAA